MDVSPSDAVTSGSQEVDQKLQMSSKPLHRFINGEPKCLGVSVKLWTVRVLRNMLENRQRYKYNEGHSMSLFPVAFSRLLFCFLEVQSS